ncbi:MAG TPA: SDR family oxidoreductase [Bryobacteraceae bacterium]|jgi:NAD(P)-dependent dehydrogenase (short-subunit alcohol dehydrogenase family)
MFDFSGKSVLVTGGSSGIGLAIASAFARAGAQVVAAGLRSDNGEPIGAKFADLDVTDGDAVNDLVSQIPALDCLVNAAGIISRDKEFELDTFTRVIDVNLTGAMRVSMAAHPKLAQSRGAIVNIASMLTYFGGPRVPAYSASKGGIAQLTRSLAVAWANDSIRVNAVAPGWIATPLTQALRNDVARSNELLSRTPFRRWGNPEEVAGPVLFLCSEAASFITGAVIPVDGGYSAA